MQVYSEQAPICISCAIILIIKQYMHAYRLSFHMVASFVSTGVAIIPGTLRTLHRCRGIQLWMLMCFLRLLDSLVRFPHTSHLQPRHSPVCEGVGVGGGGSGL